MLRLQIEAWDRCRHITFGCGFATLNTTPRERSQTAVQINSTNLYASCMMYFLAFGWYVANICMDSCWIWMAFADLDVSLLPETALEQCMEDTGPVISSSGPWHEALESDIIGICLHEHSWISYIYIQHICVYIYIHRYTVYRIVKMSYPWLSPNCNDTMAPTGC